MGLPNKQTILFYLFWAFQKRHTLLLWAFQKKTICFSGPSNKTLRFSGPSMCCFFSKRRGRDMPRPGSLPVTLESRTRARRRSPGPWSRRRQPELESASFLFPFRDPVFLLLPHVLREPHVFVWSVSCFVFCCSLLLCLLFCFREPVCLLIVCCVVCFCCCLFFVCVCVFAFSCCCFSPSFCGYNTGTNPCWSLFGSFSFGSWCLILWERLFLCCFVFYQVVVGFPSPLSSFWVVGLEIRPPELTAWRLLQRNK